MALIGVNAVRGRPLKKRSTLDQIAEGVQLAQSVLGLGLAAPEFLQKRGAVKADQERAEDKAKMDRGDFELGVLTKTREPKMIFPSQAETSGGGLAERLAPPRMEGGARVITGAEKFGPRVPLQSGNLKVNEMISLASKTLDPADFPEGTPNGYVEQNFPGIGPRYVETPLAVAARKQNVRDESTWKDLAQRSLGVMRGGTVYQNAMTKYAYAQNAMGLLEAVQDPSQSIQLTPQLAREFATALASLLGGGGSPAESQVRELVPETAQGSMAKMVQYITGNPQEFMSKALEKHFEHTLTREFSFWKDQIQSKVKALKMSGGPLWKRKPQWSEDFDEMINESFAVDRNVIKMLSKQSAEHGRALSPEALGEKLKMFSDASGLEPGQNVMIADPEVF